MVNVHQKIRSNTIFAIAALGILWAVGVSLAALILLNFGAAAFIVIGAIWVLVNGLIIVTIFDNRIFNKGSLFFIAVFVLNIVGIGLAVLVMHIKGKLTKEYVKDSFFFLAALFFGWIMILILYVLGDKRSVIKKSRSYVMFLIFNMFFMLLLSFVFLAPYLNVVAKAFNAASDTARGGIGLWPRKFTFENLMMILSHKEIINGFIITILRVIVGSALALLVTYFAAYSFLKKGIPGRGIIIMFLTIPMFFGSGLLPTYMFYSKIKILNTFWVYVLPFTFSFFNMAVIRTYLLGIPESLRESARIDGASEIRILFTIMIPLSMPILATMFLWNAVFHWNEWTSTLYYIDRGYTNLFTLQFNLQQVLKESERIAELINAAIASGRPIVDISKQMTPDAVVSAQIVVSTLPIIAIYPFIQRYFVKGVMIGSVKE